MVTVDLIIHVHLLLMKRKYLDQSFKSLQTGPCIHDFDKEFSGRTHIIGRDLKVIQTVAPEESSN